MPASDVVSLAGTKRLLTLAICLASMPCVAAERPSPDEVVVRVLASPLPSKDEEKQAFLWNTFANKPEEELFESYGVDKWKPTYWLFAKGLVEKAKAQKLDSAALGKALYSVFKDSKDRYAYLPVGAYQTTCDGTPVWIITVKWESPGWGENARLTHIRMFAFEQKTLKRVGFVTCQ